MPDDDCIEKRIAYLQRRVDEQQVLLFQQIAQLRDAVAPHDGWTISAMYQHFEVRHGDLSARMTRQIDDMRATLKDQSEALQTSLQAAFVAAEKAIDKSDEATDKQFANISQFRDQILNQIAATISRAEVEARIFSLSQRHDAEINALTQKHDDDVERGTANRLDLQRRLDVIQGQDVGRSTYRTQQGATVQQMMALAGLCLVVVSIAVTVILATRHG